MVGGLSQLSAANQSARKWRFDLLLSIYTQPFLVVISSTQLSTDDVKEEEEAQHNERCLDEAKEEKVLEREVPSATEKSYETTSKVSPSLQSDDWQDEVV